jgi:hydrogenase maturation protease
MDKQLFEQLRKFRGSRTLIVGIGNILKADDGAGPIVCEQLGRAKICADLIDAGTVPENYIQPIIKKAPQNLLVIDAIDFGASPGTIKIFEPRQLNSHTISTHTLSPRLFVDMVCQSIKRAPALRESLDVYFVGVQPAQIQLGQSVSPQVSQAIKKLCRALTDIFPPKQ